MDITPSTLLRHVVFEYPEIIVVLNRFGLRLGVGNATIADAFGGDEEQIEFFITILHTYLFENHYPDETIDKYTFGRIADYLRACNADYSRAIIPNVGRHLATLAHITADSSNLRLLQRFYEEMEQELLSSIQYDDEYLLPVLDNPESIKGKIDINIDMRFAGVREEVEAKLDDLLSFFVVHLQGVDEYNLCRAVVDALFTLKKDISQNNRIRERLLYPMLRHHIGCR